MKLYVRKWDTAGDFGLAAFILVLTGKLGASVLERFQAGDVNWIQPAGIAMFIALALFFIRRGILIIRYAAIPTISIGSGRFAYRWADAPGTIEIPIHDIVFAERTMEAMSRSTAYKVRLLLRDGTYKAFPIGSRKATDMVVEHLLKAIGDGKF